MLNKLLNIYWGWILAGIIFLCSCSKDVEPGLFEWDINVPVELPLNPNAFEGKVITIYNVPTLLKAQFAGTGVDLDRIEKIELVSASLQSDFPDQVLDFIREISLDVYDTDLTSHVEMAFKDPVDFSVRDRIDLFPSLPDITSYFKQEQVSLQLAYKVRMTNPAIKTHIFLRLKAIGVQ